jgi:lipopolysaccharide export system permease protein
VTILDRYLVKRWFLYFFPSIIVLVTISLASDVAISLWDLLRKGLSPDILALHYTFKIPYLITQVSSIASLLATLLTLTGIKRNGEMTAVFASGTSIFRLCLPVLAASFFVGLITFYLMESVVPGASRTSRDFVSGKDAATSSVVGTDRIWLREGNRVIHIRSVEDKGTMLVEPTVLQFEDRSLSTLIFRADAVSARWVDNSWKTGRLYFRRFSEGFLTETRILKDERMPIGVKPNDFYSIRRKPEDMTLSQLRRYIGSLKLAGFSYSRYEVYFYRKASAASISIIFTLLSLPVALLVPVRSGVAMGIGVSVLLCAVFWSAYSISLSLGYAGIINGAVAAWSAQAVFFILGQGALLIIRRPRLH